MYNFFKEAPDYEGMALSKRGGVYREVKRVNCEVFKIEGWRYRPWKRGLG